MGGSSKLSDSIFFWIVTIFFGFSGVIALFTNPPWGIFVAMFIFFIWAMALKLYAFSVIEDRGLECVMPEEENTGLDASKGEIPFDDPSWIIDPSVPDAAPEGRILSAGRETVSSSRIIMGPTPAGGLVTEPGKKRDSARDDDREFADMMRSL